ncbi:MAG: DUF2333 family protein [Thermodesulfobacteriota bacterium]
MIQLPKGRRLVVGAIAVLILILGFVWLLGSGEKPQKTVSEPPGETEPANGFAPVLEPSSEAEPSAASNRVKGITFLDAVIEPLQSELDRFWGWRPNDLIQFTDNVNHYQLGVIEATRRTSIVLAERISRTGSSDPYVRELEQAMSMFAIDPNTWLFPRAEGKYQEGLDNIRSYRRMLLRNEARFYNRMDNLVPLILTYESILGSVTENLLRRDLSFFEVDDMFFYSKGVSAMILSAMEGVGVDFRDTLEAAQSIEVYEEIILSLRRIVEMKPPVVLDGGPNSIWANHRANVAGPMSRVRFLMHILYGALTGDL